MKIQERVNFTMSDGKYIGQMVDIPGVIMEATSMEELSRKMKVAGKIFLATIKETLDQDDPFEFVYNEDFDKNE